MTGPAKKLVGAFLTQYSFDVLVPKKLGKGYLQVPLGHHENEGLRDISNNLGCDVEGLDGFLSFECGYTDLNEMEAYAERVLSKLEAHYGFGSEYVGPTSFQKLFNPTKGQEE